MSKGLTVQQMEFLASKGLSLSDVIEFANLPGPDEQTTSGALRTRAYRARRNISDNEWAALTGLVIERDGWVCTYCDCDTSLEENGHAVDHVLALARGGTNDIDNLTMSCRSCNSSKQDKLIDDEWTRPNDDFARRQAGERTQ